MGPWADVVKVPVKQVSPETGPLYNTPRRPHISGVGNHAGITGDPNMSSLCHHAFVWESAACQFGCGVRVHKDSGVCPSCHDHAENEVECAKCGELFRELDAMRYDLEMYALENK